MVKFAGKTYVWSLLGNTGHIGLPIANGALKKKKILSRLGQKGHPPKAPVPCKLFPEALEEDFESPRKVENCFSQDHTIADNSLI